MSAAQRLLRDVGRNPRLWRQIAQIAAAQHGNVTREQLLGAGLGEDGMYYAVRTGRLFRVFRGVYAVGYPPVKPIDRAAAAALACGPRSALSHGSAMTLWGFWRHWDEPFELTVTADRRPTGIRIHRCCTLRHRDVTIHHGIQVTSPARTLLDVASRMRPRSLTRVVNDSRRAKLLTLEGLDDVTGRNPSHPGARLLRAYVEDPHNPTRSGSEDDLLGFCQRYGLPRPLINTMVHGFEVDAYFEAERVIVEVDGWPYHKDQVSFEGDRDRDATMLAHQIPTVRVTTARLGGDPDREAARLHAILQGRRAA